MRIYSFAPTTDFKAPNTEDAEENDKFIEKVLEGNATSADQPVRDILFCLLFVTSQT